MYLRTKKLQEFYLEYKKTAPYEALHKEPSIREWQYWRLINNRFPYNKLASAHALVVLKRDCSIFHLTEDELNELWGVILTWADRIYDTSIVNFSSVRSVNHTPHVHLITYLDN